MVITRSATSLIPAMCSAGSSGSAKATYVISWRRRRWRMRCHVRSFPPLSSGSSRSAFSQRIRMGYGMRRRQMLHAAAVDECAVPKFEIEEAPDAIARVGASGGMVREQVVDRRGIDHAALAGPPVEQDFPRHVVPAAAHPIGERNRKAQLGPL